MIKKWEDIELIIKDLRDKGFDQLSYISEDKQDHFRTKRLEIDLICQMDRFIKSIKDYKHEIELLKSTGKDMIRLDIEGENIFAHTQDIINSIETRVQTVSDYIILIKDALKKIREE